MTSAPRSGTCFTDDTRVLWHPLVSRGKEKQLTFADSLQVAKTVQCTITVAGFMKGSNKEIAVASYTFTPPLNVVGQVPMVKAVLPSTFIKVYNVTMIQDSPTTQALGLDNLTYTVS